MKTEVSKQNVRMASVTPCEIEVAIYYHYMCEPHPRGDSPAVKHAIEKLLRCGILEPNSDHDSSEYKTTERGRAWIKLLCQVKFPKQIWVEDTD